MECIHLNEERNKDDEDNFTSNAHLKNLYYLKLFSLNDWGATLKVTCLTSEGLWGTGGQSQGEET